MSQSDRSKEEVSVAERSPFVRLLSTPGRVRILDVLLRQYNSKMTASQIADAAGIDEGTFSRNKDVLIDLDLVQTERAGQQTLYQVNEKNEVVQILARAHIELLKHAPEVVDKTEVTEKEYIGKIKSVGSSPPSEKTIVEETSQEEMLQRFVREESAKGQSEQ